MEPPLYRRLALRAGFPAVLAVASVALYHGILGLWWLADDFFHLRFLLSHPRGEYWISPAPWRELPFRMLTPLLFQSLDADFALFGANSRGFYAHQLFSLALAAIALYAVFRLWLSPAWSASGAMLFLLGVPTASIAPLLMLRHYIEGTILAALSVRFFVESLRKESRARDVASAVLFLFAALAKEIFVPLPFLLLVLPDSSFRRRFRAAFPHFLLLLVYALWRYRFLGTFLGGYGWAVRAREFPALALTLPASAAGMFFGSVWWANFLLGAALLVAFITFVARRPVRLVTIGICVVLALAPILPVAKAMEPRYALPLWIFASMLVTLCARDLFNGKGIQRALSLALIGSALLASFVVNRDVWKLNLSRDTLVSREGQFFLTMKPGQFLRHPAREAASFEGLRWFKEDYLHGARGAGWFADDLFLCFRIRPGDTIFEFDPSAGSLRNRTERIAPWGDSFCSSIRRGAALTASFERAGDSIFWRLGPWLDGRYAFLIDDGRSSFPVPVQGGYRRAWAPRISLRIRYDSPAGWTTCSPELLIDLTRTRTFTWERREGVADVPAER